MKITECKHNIRCELGVCRNRATREVEFDRAGKRASLHMCDKCMAELYSAIGEVTVPRSVETARRRSKGESK